MIVAEFWGNQTTVPDVKELSAKVYLPLNKSFLYKTFPCTPARIFHALHSLLGTLSKDVFERRTSTGSEAFSLFICLDANKLVLLSFFSLLKTIYPRVSTKPLPSDAKSPLPVDVRRSKTLLLKLPNNKKLIRKGTAKRLCVTTMTGLLLARFFVTFTCHYCVLVFCKLKYLFKGRWRFGGIVFFKHNFCHSLVT